MYTQSKAGKTLAVLGEIAEFVGVFCVFSALFFMILFSPFIYLSLKERSVEKVITNKFEALNHEEVALDFCMDGFCLFSTDKALQFYFSGKENLDARFMKMESIYSAWPESFSERCGSVFGPRDEPICHL